MTNHYVDSVEIPDETYWELVKLAANLEMHIEPYIQNVLIGHVEQELDRKTNSADNG